MSERRPDPLEPDANDMIAALKGKDVDMTLTMGASMFSIAISLKRIADAIEGRPDKLGLVDHLAGVLSDSIYNLKT